MNKRRKLIIVHRSGALAKPVDSFSRQPAPTGRRIGRLDPRRLMRNARRMVATEGNVKMFPLTMVAAEPLAKV